VPRRPCPTEDGQAGDVVEREAAQPALLGAAGESGVDGRGRRPQAGPRQLHRPRLARRPRRGDDRGDVRVDGHPARPGAPSLTVEQVRGADGGQGPLAIGVGRPGVEWGHGYACIPRLVDGLGRVGRGQGDGQQHPG
jgi:hypothetical protein